MSYVKKTWVTGEVAYASDLNNMENGIAANDTAVTQLAEEMPEKANKGGNYEDMTVGNAEQLVSSVYVEDSEPYNFRTSGGSADIGTREYDEIVGLSVGWNQALNPNRADVTGHGITFHNNEDGSFTVTGTADANAYFYFTGSPSVPIPTGNGVIYMRGCPEGGGTNTYCITTNCGGWKNDVGAGIIFNKTSDMLNCSIKIGNGTTVSLEFWPQVFNLTQMFGSTIADYILGLETGTAGAGVAWLKSHFPKMFGSYQPYDAGSIKSVEGLSAHVMTGFNCFDKAKSVLGETINVNSGAFYAASGRWRSDYIKCIPGTSYQITGLATDANSFVAFYDADKKFISRTAAQNTGTIAVTTPVNCAYMAVTMYQEGTDTRDNVCCHIVLDGSRNGEYEPYKEWTYPLDSTKTYRGIFKLDANNNLYADGDYYYSDGTDNVRYKEVKLGSYNWTYETSSALTLPRFACTLTDPAPSSPYWTTDCVISARYTRGNNIGQNANDMRYGIAQNHVYITDSNYTDAASFKAALAADNVTLLYKLATPTTESADPYQSPQIVDDFGTEEYVSESIVPVGHNTKYPADLVQKIEDMPEIPAAPSADGEYTLKATVSGGTTSYSWVSET